MHPNKSGLGEIRRKVNCVVNVFFPNSQHLGCRRAKTVTSVLMHNLGCFLCSLPRDGSRESGVADGMHLPYYDEFHFHPGMHSYSHNVMRLRLLQIMASLGSSCNILQSVCRLRYVYSISPKSETHPTILNFLCITKTRVVRKDPLLFTNNCSSCPIRHFCSHK